MSNKADHYQQIGNEEGCIDRRSLWEEEIYE